MLSDDQIKSIRSSRNVILMAFVVIEAITLYNWLVRPHANYLMAAQRYESVTANLVRKSKSITNNVIIKKKKLEKLQDKFKHIHIRLFDSVKAKEFFSDIQALAEETNCVVYSLSFSTADSTFDAHQLEVSSHITANSAVLSVGGKYKDIIVLISKMQDRPKQVWIDSISIESISQNSDLLKCDMAITIYVIHSEGKRDYG